METSGTLVSMKDKRRGIKPMDIWRMILAVIGIVAVIQELRKPPDERTWEGKVADLVPYDFRLPTVERAKATYWNPEGPMISGKLFGVGWAPNFGYLARLLGKSS